MSKHDEHHSHHILPEGSAVKVWIGLLILTVVTVGVAQFNLGVLNFPVAMLVATVKAALVVMFFMGMRWDTTENRIIFLGSLVFVAIFIVLTFADFLTRGDVYVKGPVVAESKGVSKFKKPWVSSPELLAHGKAAFDMQCASCHGPKGMGDGVAAAALNPKPKNFTDGAGWKNGRKPTEVFGTLTKGLGGMPSFGSLPADDRWALAHYVLAFGPPAPKDTLDDFKKAGIDPNSDGGGAAESVLPIEFTIERMAE